MISDGLLVAYLERGGRTALTWTAEQATLASAAEAVAATVRSGAVRDLTVERIDGEPALTGEHPLAAALLLAGFHQTPKGVRLRTT